MAYPSKKKSPVGCFIFLGIFILAGLVHGAVRYFSDKPIFEEAHAAYLIGDCDKAIPLYDEIIHKFRTLDFRDIKENAISESSDCSLFRVAAREGVGGLYQFTQDFPDSQLNEVAAAKASDLLHEATDDSDLSSVVGGVSCEIQSQLETAGWLTREDTLPLYLYYCSRYLVQQSKPDAAFQRVSSLMSEFPGHSLTDRVWTSMADSPVFCGILENIETLEISSEREESLPEIYLTCGANYRETGDLADAAEVYTAFLKKYPDHASAEEVSRVLAELLVANAKASGSGTIERPDSSGWAPSGVARVVIQNDSPHQLKLVFSGPDARIEILEPCPTCIDYSTIGPVYCPEEGPMETYELTPGTYEVLVEASDEGGVIPFTGTWELQGGNEFYSCFFVVTSWN